jgi:hypothetical protein
MQRTQIHLPNRLMQALYRSLGSRGRSAALPPDSTTTTSVRRAVLGPTLFDTTQLFWPAMNGSSEIGDTVGGSEGGDSAGGAGTSGAAASQFRQQPAESLRTAVTYGKEGGESCSLDLAVTAALEFCAPGLVCQRRTLWSSLNSTTHGAVVT